MCSCKYTSPSIPPSRILDVDTWIFTQSCHPLSSEGKMHALSSAHCDPPALASTSQTFPSSSSCSLHSCVLIPKTVTAPKTLSCHLSPFIPLIPCLSRPSLYLCHCFPPSLGASSSIPSQVSLLQWFFPAFSSGRFWSLLSITHGIQNYYLKFFFFFSLKKSTLQVKLQFIKA